MKGKDKCEFLRGIRKRMAELNGIPYEPRECTYEGECTGTCPFCEKEAAELLAKLKEKEAEGAEIMTDDVGILAIELGINDCQESNEVDKYHTVLTEAEDAPVNINAETSTPSIDPFRGSNNPFMSGKDLRELRQERNNKRSEPLMGDIDDEEYRKHKDEEFRNKQEEDSTDEEERKGGFSKIITQIKRVVTQGLIEDEE